LELQNLSHIVCFSFLFWTLYKQGGVVIQFHIKKFVHMGWTNKKGQPKKKTNYAHF
jgi:dipeptide/tripeptide permease